MNSIFKAFGVVSLLVCGLANAAPTPTVIELGVIDNTLTTLERFQTGEFIDIFNFQVTGGGFAFAVALGTLGVPDFSFGVNLGAGVLYDAAFNVLVQDLDGSDGLELFSTLNTAGTYRFAVLGNTLVSGGTYFVGILPVVQSIPEPASALLALSALAGLALLKRGQTTA